MGSMKDLLGDAPYEPPKPPEIEPTRNFRNSDPSTSEAAFRSVEPGITKTHLRILRALETAKTSTASEMMDHIGMIYNSTWRRLSELKKAGMITNTEETRKNPRGQSEVVFALTPAGAAYVEANRNKVE